MPHNSFLRQLAHAQINAFPLLVRRQCRLKISCRCFRVKTFKGRQRIELETLTIHLLVQEKALALSKTTASQHLTQLDKSQPAFTEKLRSFFKNYCTASQETGSELLASDLGH